MDNNIQQNVDASNQYYKWFWRAAKVTLYAGSAFTITQNACPFLGNLVGRPIANITALTGCTVLSSIGEIASETLDLNGPLVGATLGAFVAFGIGVSPFHAIGSYVLYKTLFKAGEVSLNALMDVKRSFSPFQKQLELV